MAALDSLPSVTPKNLFKSNLTRVALFYFGKEILLFSIRFIS